ncbi:eukaryotic translation initiation factor 3 subunit B-like [Triticum aestivum]|uniref:eukaryotic translation initiation factor 3 subunit B-like n=1 Tax=Triticum aestivum TaxID=4565 RepID=UPI001D00AB75|nr:eukaryotic translation initiation factor 3 subunit B-like [Triticum aestivum]
MAIEEQLEFYNFDDLETMATKEHSMVTDVRRDPTGRYVATALTVHGRESNQIWSFTGKQIYKVTKKQFSQFEWRPRPPSLLTLAKEEEISMNDCCSSNE